MKTISVTDHALLRWLQREHDLDIDRLRVEMVKRIEAAALCGATVVKSGKVKFVIAQTPELATFVTVVEKHMEARPPKPILR